MIFSQHLKELTFSFKKNKKSLELDIPNKSYGCLKIPPVCIFKWTNLSVQFHQLLSAGSIPCFHFLDLQF